MLINSLLSLLLLFALTNGEELKTLNTVIEGYQIETYLFVWGKTKAHLLDLVLDYQSIKDKQNNNKFAI